MGGRVELNFCGWLVIVKCGIQNILQDRLEQKIATQRFIHPKQPCVTVKKYWIAALGRIDYEKASGRNRDNGEIWWRKELAMYIRTLMKVLQRTDAFAKDGRDLIVCLQDNVVPFLQVQIEIESKLREKLEKRQLDQQCQVLYNMKAQWMNGMQVLSTTYYNSFELEWKCSKGFSTCGKTIHLILQITGKFQKYKMSKNVCNMVLSYAGSDTEVGLESKEGKSEENTEMAIQQGAMHLTERSCGDLDLPFSKECHDEYARGNASALQSICNWWTFGRFYMHGACNIWELFLGLLSLCYQSMWNKIFVGQLWNTVTVSSVRCLELSEKLQIVVQFILWMFIGFILIKNATFCIEGAHEMQEWEQCKAIEDIGRWKDGGTWPSPR